MLIELQLPTPQIAASLLMLTAGVMVCTWRSGSAGSAAAIITCLTGTVCNAAMMSFTGRVMTKNISALQLTYITAPVSLAVIAPLVYIHEVCLKILIEVQNV